MGRMVPFPIVGGSYTDDSLPWAHQDTVNYLPVKAERAGTRSPSKLAMVPGMRVFADIGTGPYRGGRDVEGKRFVVSGTKLYQVSVAGVATELGTIPGTGRVCMTHNQITGGNQLVIGNGSSGYVYNTYSGAFAQITDDAFPGAKSLDFLNQYVIGVEPFGRYWFHSALADAESYNALDVYQAETQSDRIMELIAMHNEALVFGERTIEPWTNVPTENAAFQLQRGSVIESGCASGNTICKLDNSVFYLTENGQIARLNGYTPEIVSTYALEGAIRDADWSRAFAFTWEDKGHTVYYITFPEVGTFGWDVRQREWHRRKSFGIDRWRLNTLFKSAGEWYGGDYQTGKLYRLDWSYALDGCDPIERIRTCGYIHDNGNRVTVNAFEVRVDAGAVESVKHDGVTITGAMPDAYVGEVVSFQYTVTTAYPGQSYTLQASGLPDGLSMSATGLVTGTATTAGAFSPTISSVDECGTALTYTDSVEVYAVTYDATFRYTTEAGGISNPNDYSATAYDDSAWSEGQGGFGGVPAGLIGQQIANTPITGGDGVIVWLRRDVVGPVTDLRIDVYHDDAVWVWWNGVAQAVTDINSYHGYVLIDAADVTGNDVIAMKVIDMYPSGSPNVYASLEITA